ncbi:MAG: hypothetical protein JEY91_10255, partial [Spirochaetaceae bacterium]|nr:hypothetical protein [Spirochaetaceae bacterium]
RLQDHKDTTVPVMEKYHSLYGLVKIDGDGTFEEVYERISSEIEKGLASLR